MFCYRCGKEIMDNALFCPYCGQDMRIGEKKVQQPVMEPAPVPQPAMVPNPVSQPVVQAPPAPQPEKKPPKKKSGKKTALIIFLILLLLALIGVGVFFLLDGFGKDEDKSVDSKKGESTLNGYEIMLGKNTYDLSKSPEELLKELISDGYVVASWRGMPYLWDKSGKKTEQSLADYTGEIKKNLCYAEFGNVDGYVIRDFQFSSALDTIPFFELPGGITKKTSINKLKKKEEFTPISYGLDGMHFYAIIVDGEWVDPKDYRDDMLEYLLEDKLSYGEIFFREDYPYERELAYLTKLGIYIKAAIDIEPADDEKYMYNYALYQYIVSRNLYKMQKGSVESIGILVSYPYGGSKSNPNIMHNFRVITPDKTGAGHGSGGASGSTDTPADDGSPSDVWEGDAPQDTSSKEEGKVLNIYCWNTEFMERIRDHYKGYEAIDATTGRIGDVTVRWVIKSTDNDEYQTYLDSMLRNQVLSEADNKVDIFLVEADYASKYINSNYTMSVSNLGITESELSEMYPYTKALATDENGRLKGLSWQCCPTVLFYNRAMAKEVLGTDDPNEVQKYLSDWDGYYETAGKMREYGYFMNVNGYETYRVYANNAKTSWYQNGSINVDSNVRAWADGARKMFQNGYCVDGWLWDNNWMAGFYPSGGIFCYFGPAWMIDYVMTGDNATSVASYGGWGACLGPQSSFWGGTWICAAAGTDNETLVADIMRQMTTNPEVMTEIAAWDNDFVNNKKAMESLSQSGFSSAPLGGQNPLPIYCKAAESIVLPPQSPYDYACSTAYQNAMYNYIYNYSTYEEALQYFYELCPNIN